VATIDKKRASINLQNKVFSAHHSYEQHTSQNDILHRKKSDRIDFPYEHPATKLHFMHEMGEQISSRVR
jgi:hypothetical protein